MKRCIHTYISHEHVTTSERDGKMYMDVSNGYGSMSGCDKWVREHGTTCYIGDKVCIDMSKVLGSTYAHMKWVVKHVTMF
jgi:hypothetical protein